MGAFNQIDPGSLEALLGGGVPGLSPGQLPSGMAGQAPPPGVQPQMNKDDIIAALFQQQQAPQVSQAPQQTTSLDEQTSLDEFLNQDPPLPERKRELDVAEAKRRKDEETINKYLLRTPKIVAQEEMEGRFGKPGERTKTQKFRMVADIIRQLGQGGPPMREQIREQAEQEYAKVAPQLRGELSIIAADRRAEAQRLETARVKDEALAEKQRQFDLKQIETKEKADLTKYFKEEYHDILRERLAGTLSAQEAEVRYKDERTRLTKSQEEAVDQAVKAGPRVNQQRAELMTSDEMTSKGLDPDDPKNFETKRTMYLRNLKMLVDAQPGGSGRRPVGTYKPTKQGYDPKTFQPVFATWEKAGGPPIVTKMSGAPHKGYIIPTDKDRDEVFKFQDIENRYRNMVKNVIENPDVLGFKNIQGSELQAVTGQLSLAQMKLFQTQVQAVSQYVTQQSGVQYGFRELVWLKQVFPTILSKDPRLYMHGLANLYAGVMAMRMMKQYGLKPGEVDLPGAMDWYAEHMLQQVGKNPNTVNVPSAKTILTRAAEMKGYMIMWDGEDPTEVVKKQ